MNDFKTILLLSERNNSGKQEFGGKAAGLFEAMENDAVTARGFVISASLCRRIAESNNVAKYQKLLAPFVTEILGSSSTRKLIVRSSSKFENNSEGLFAGLFDSYNGITSVEKLVVSISKIVQNSKLSHISPYFKKFGLDQGIDHMAILVQEQMDYEIAGIAQFNHTGGFVEYTLGDLAHALAGSKELSHFSFEVSNEGEFKNSIAELSEPEHAIWLAFVKSKKFINFARNNNLTVEFAVKGSDLIVFQVKNAIQLNLPLPESISRFGDSRLSNKTMAMDFFISKQLFNKKCIILRSGSEERKSPSKMRDSIKFLFKSDSKVTIRSANGGSIGLPRTFVDSIDDALNFIQSQCAEYHDVILHEYINVTRSFEILISKGKYYIEHIPGMWESNNVLQPDVFIHDNVKKISYLYSKTRIPILDKNSVSDLDINFPISKPLEESFFEMGDYVSEVIRNSFLQNKSINVHAVWDSISNSYQCINIRPGFDFEGAVVHVSDLWQICSFTDFDAWDRKTPVRLTLSTFRGSENTLIEIARELAASKVLIAIDFGILSHPAMVLREYGCKLVPTYMISSCFNKSDYEINVSKDDIQNEPVQRIFSEPCIISNQAYHIVRDHRPLTNNHFLCVAKLGAPSVADSGEIESVIEALENLSQDDEAFYFERGRASFCTSGFTIAHDHFHVILEANSARTVDKMRNLLGGELYKTLIKLYADVLPEKEYIVFGSKAEGFFLSYPQFVSKQILRRNFIPANLTKMVA